MAVNIHELQAKLKTQLLRAQEQYSASANKNRTKPPELAIGDQVYVSTENITSTRPTRKLAEQYIGPFDIIGQPSRQSYLIQFPDHLKMIHPVFHISQLEPYRKDDFPGRIQPPPEEIEVDGIPEWEVREIMDAKIDRRRRVPLMFLVKWFGFEGLPNEIQWLPADFVEHSKDAVQDFYRLHPDKPGSYEEYLTYLPESDPDSDSD